MAIGVAVTPPAGESPPAVAPAPPATEPALESEALPPATPAFESEALPPVAPAAFDSDDLPPVAPAPALESDILPPVAPAPAFESDDLPPAAPAPALESPLALDSADLPPVATGLIDFVDPPALLLSGASLPAPELDLPVLVPRAIGESVPLAAEAPFVVAPVAVEDLPSGMPFELPPFTAPEARAGLVRPERAADRESPPADDAALPEPAPPREIGERPLDLPDAPFGDASLGPEDP